MKISAFSAVKFKDTELGPLPEDWQVVRLGEVASIGPSRTPRENRHLIPFVPMSLIPESSTFISQWEFRAPEEIRSGVAISEGDFLLAKITPCFENGKQGTVTNIPGGWGYATTEVFPIRSKDELEIEFLALYLLQPDVRQNLASKMEGTTGRQRLPKAAVISLSIPLPPLPEQRAIAHVLRTVQQAREATERVIAALRQLKKSLMRHLFTYGPVPVGNVGAQRPVPLQETEIGPIPEHWQVVRLGEVVERPQYGYTASASDAPVGPKFLRITDIQNGKVLWPSVPFCEVAHSKVENYLLKPGDILVARIGATTGKTFLVAECLPAIFASYLIRLRVVPEKGLLSDYLSYFTDTEAYWAQINSNKGGRLKQGINIPILENLVIPLPPLPEQREIARILQAVDRRIAAEEAYVRALGDLFKSLLHELMTARRRVPPDFVAQFVGAQRHCTPTSPTTKEAP